MEIVVSPDRDRCSFKIRTVDDPNIDVFDNYEALGVMFGEGCQKRDLAADHKNLYENISSLEGRISSHNDNKIKIVIGRTISGSILSLSIYFKVDGSYSKSNFMCFKLNNNRSALDEIIGVLYDSKYLVGLKIS